MYLGIFPYVSAISWLPLIPGAFWDRWAAKPSVLHSLPLSEAAESKYLNVFLNGVAGFFLVYVFMWNLRTTNFDRYKPFLTESMNPVGFAFGVDQYWSMFAPNPMRGDGWYVAVGTLKDGRQVDLLRGGQPVCREKPERVAELFPSERWRKYLENISQEKHQAHRFHFSRYLWRKWDEQHSGDERLERIELYYMLEMTELNRTITPPRPIRFHLQESEEAVPVDAGDNDTLEEND